MEKLSLKLWRCKCGHREKVKPSKQEKAKKETREENAEEEYRTRFWEETKGEVRQKRGTSRGREIVDKRKRTSV